MTLNTQSLASIFRQILAITGIVFSVLTASVSSLHLPVAVSTYMGVAGAIVLAIEHYVSDPSTGTTQGTTTTTTVVVPPTSTPAAPK